MTDFPGFGPPSGSIELPVTVVEKCIGAPGVFFVRGDCMAGARIHDGDIAVVDFGREARAGSIVVFSACGGQAKGIKRLVSCEGGTVHLESTDGLHLVFGPEAGWSLAVVVATIGRPA